MYIVVDSPNIKSIELAERRLALGRPMRSRESLRIKAMLEECRRVPGRRSPKKDRTHLASSTIDKLATHDGWQEFWFDFDHRLAMTGLTADEEARLRRDAEVKVAKKMQACADGYK